MRCDIEKAVVMDYSDQQTVEPANLPTIGDLP